MKGNKTTENLRTGEGASRYCKMCSSSNVLDLMKSKVWFHAECSHEALLLKWL